MGFKNNDRCLAKADDDEPIFVLRAQDTYALEAIQHWLGLAGLGLTPEHLEEVRDCEEDFRAWQRQHPNRVKVPD